MRFSLDKEVWRPYVQDIYQRLHEIPEISWQEVKTTLFLKEALIRLSYTPLTIPGCTGVIGVRGKGPFTVALRADMDALPHETGGVQRAIHSCGHDAHMAMVLAAAGVLSQMPLPEGTALKMIFQPAEEKGEGALRLIQAGFMDDVDFLFGVHLRPGEELSGGELSPAVEHGAAKTIHGEIKGMSAHGARPHLGINVIEVAFSFLQMVQGIHLDSLIPASVKMTRLTAGAAENSIPDHGIFTLDLRAQTNEQMKKIVAQVERIAAGVAMAYGAGVELILGGELPAAQTSPAAREIISRAITDAVGRERLAPPIMTPGAEDFHYYTQQRPTIKSAMLGLGCDLQPGLHHPDMRFEKSFLIDGVEVLARTVWYAVNGS